MKRALPGLLLLATAGSLSAGPVRVPAGSRPVPGSYIVVLAEEGSGAARGRGASEVAGELSALHGGTVAFTYEHALRGFALRATARAAAALATRNSSSPFAREGVA